MVATAVDNFTGSYGGGVFTNNYYYPAPLGFAFQGFPPSPCVEASVADGNGTYNGLTNSTYTLTHAFIGGPPPPAPYHACGQDPDPNNSLGCNWTGC